jgi:AcrR family transcriptional regulator
MKRTGGGSMEKTNKRKEDLARTHEAILSVASELFMAKGFKNTSTREIALQANITQPNLYHHFKNKKELYIAVISQLTERVQKKLTPIVRSADSIEDKLHRLIKVLLEEHPANLFLMLNDMLQEMGTEYNKVLYGIFKQTYIDNISAIFEKNESSPVFQKNICAADATRFVLYNVSALLSVERTYRRKTEDKDITKICPIDVIWDSF